MDLILIKPAAEYAAEIETFRREYLEGKPDGDDFDGSSGLEDYDDVLKWVEFCRTREREKTPPSAVYVVGEQFMLIKKGERKILGLINLRHSLGTEKLRKYSGHIGYCVLPSERRKGYAKAMLSLCLARCRELKIDKVLITCKVENEASRRTILSQGGLFERIVHKNEDDVDLERYWVNI